MYVYIHTPKHIIYIGNKLAQKNSKHQENVIYEKERKKPYLLGPFPLVPTVEIGRGSFFLSISTKLYIVF